LSFAACSFRAVLDSASEHKCCTVWWSRWQSIDIKPDPALFQSGSPRRYSALNVVSAIWFSADSKSCLFLQELHPASCFNNIKNITGSGQHRSLSRIFLRSVQRGLCRFFLSLRGQQS